jgi:hypothetical protein
MGTKPQSRKKPITVIQVACVALIFAIAGGIYGFFTGGPISMITIFAESFVASFVLIYVVASFIELSRKSRP